jgi:peroxiredoxin
MQELPELEAAHKSGVYTVVGVTDDTPAQIEAVRRKYELSFPLYQLEEPIRKHGVHSLPTSYLINASGEVVLSITGTREWNSAHFMNKVDALLSKE